MTKNNRYQTAKVAGGLGPKESGATEALRRHGFSPAAVARLELKWAFGLPFTSSAYGQPTVVDGRIFIGSDSGYLYSLDAATGCVHWSFQAQAGLRSTPMIGPLKRGSNQMAAFFGDIRGNAYAVDASSGKLLWKRESTRIRWRASRRASRSMKGASTFRWPRSKSPSRPASTTCAARFAAWSRYSMRQRESRSGRHIRSRKNPRGEERTPE